MSGIWTSRRNFIWIVALLCLMLCGTLAASFNVSKNITAELRENAYDSLMNASEIIRQNIDTAMGDDVALVSAFGEMLHETDYHDMTLRMYQFCRINQLLHIRCVNEKGVGISETGEYYESSYLPVPETALSGEASISPGYVGETGQEHLLIQTPILSDGRTVGAVYCEVVATRYYSVDAFVFLDGQGRAALINRADGTFVIKAPQSALAQLKDDNIYSAIALSNDDAYNAFAEKIASGAKSIMQMQYSGADSYIAILPCKTNANLYVVTFISREALQVQADSISRLIVTMQSILIVGLSGLIVFSVLLLYRAMKEEQARKTRELTERSREELTAALVKAEEANVAKTQFLSNMSHDIRTPMNAIIGMASLAEQTIDDEERLRDCLGIIMASSRHLLALINDILEISKIESGNLTLESEPFALPVAINSISSIVSPLCKAKEQTFIVELIDVTHEYVIGDKTKMSQVLINLLNNANKFTPAGGEIRLLVEELPSASPGTAAYRFTVSDNGVGIPEDKQSAIFDAFVRAEDATTGDAEGTGLGLSIARSIVRAMGGGLELKSEYGAGSSFIATIAFPVQCDLSAMEGYGDLSGKRALVADEDVGRQKRICSHLTGVGVSSDSAASGREALNMVENALAAGGGYDIAILPWELSDMDGEETVRRIRQAAGPGIHIVVFTGADWQQVEPAAYAAGANAVLSKPLFQSSLIEKLSQMQQYHFQQKTPREMLRGARILVVEDNRINQTVAKSLLEGVGAAVEIAENGQVGAEIFLSSEPGTYSAILMDIQMPVLNGYEATARIRNSDHPDAASIPIIALTANAFSEDNQRASEAGMDAHLTKPIVPRAVFDTLKRFIDT